MQPFGNFIGWINNEGFRECASQKNSNFIDRLGWIQREERCIVVCTPDFGRPFSTDSVVMANSQEGIHGL
jgi:hypothetical protein